MELVRNVKYSLKYLTEYKRTLLDMLFDEYQVAVNHYINYLWKHPKLKGTDLKKDVLNVYDHDWMTQRLKQCACKQALAIVKTTRANKRKMPFFNGNVMSLSSNCVSLEDSKESTFDHWIKIGSISQKGYFSDKIEFIIPINSHRYANKYKYWKKASTFNFNRNGMVSIAHSTKIPIKKTEGDLLGVDLGLNKLFACSDDTFKADRSLELVKKVHRKKQNSLAQKRAKEELKSYINHSIKNEFDWKNLRLIVTESKISDVKRNMKLEGRLSKNIRSLISNLPIGYIMERIQRECENNRVVFRSVPAYYTSQDCRICGHRDKRNRKTQECFCCTECGHSEHADLHASKNILNRFIFGTYGSEFKTI